ncbi:MAG TPA: hypothetical protein VIP11_13030, partial [Gemmatimonadaceae bacterium]
MQFRTLTLTLLAVALTACRSAPNTPPPPPPALPDSAAAALRWVDAHSTAFQSNDSVASPAERA